MRGHERCARLAMDVNSSMNQAKVFDRRLDVVAYYVEEDLLAELAGE